MKKSALLMLILRVVGAMMTYVFVVFLARFTSTKDFGFIGIVFSSSLLLSVLASYGQQQALIRFIPSLIQKGNTAGVFALVAAALRLMCLGNVILWGVLCLTLLVAYALGFFGPPWALMLGLVIIPLTAAVDFQAYLARAYKGVILAVVPKDILWRLLSLTVLAIIFWVNGKSPIPLYLVFSVLVVVLGMIVVAITFLAPRLNGTPRLKDLTNTNASAFNKEEWRASSRPLMLTSFTALVFSNLDVLIVSLFLGAEMAGLYFAANRIAQFPRFFIQSYSVIVGSLISEAAAAGSRSELQSIVSQATLFTFAPTLASSALIALFSTQILQLFGSEFVSITTPLYLLLLASVFNAAFGHTELLLTMSGHERVAMKLSLWTVGIGLALLLVGTWQLGATGSAGAIALAILVRKLLFWRAAVEHLAVRSDFISAIFGSKILYARKSKDSED